MVVLLYAGRWRDFFRRWPTLEPVLLLKFCLAESLDSGKRAGRLTSCFSLGLQLRLEYISVLTLLTLLVILYLVSGLITVSETALLTCNRLLLNTKAKSGHAGAKLSLSLLEKTGTVLGGTLLWKVMANTAIAALSMLLTLKLFVDDYWTLTAACLVVSLSALILVELIPKAVGTAYADSLETH